MVTQPEIIKQLKHLNNFAEDNLGQLEGFKLDKDNEIQDFYLGYIRRQSYFSIDLISIFENKKHTGFISQLILSRCIVDDYIHLMYAVNQPNVDETIICINADAHKKNFDKISELTDVNEEILGGKVPFYPTSMIREALKINLQNNPKKSQYFTDAQQFKFKSIKTTGNFIKDFPKNKLGANIRRAYYLWRHLSDYVHYSKFSFDFEFYVKEDDNSLNIIQEMIFYSFKIVRVGFAYFQQKHNLSLIDKHNLVAFYKPIDESE
jgi:hypothetical protein